MEARWLAVVLLRVRFALVESAGCGFPFFAGVGCPLLKFSATHPGRGGDAGASQPPGSQSVSMAACLGEASVTGEGFSFSESTLRLNPALSPKRHLSFRGRRGPARWCCRGPRRAIGVSYAVQLNCKCPPVHPRSARLRRWIFRCGPLLGRRSAACTAWPGGSGRRFDGRRRRGRARSAS